ncbi:MAG: hypothetical protein JRG92_02585 [Deltaproteobacteria bacterium]|jgi:hypothetical protein|nr:hypothetical protein [Deltaproteobacteria bacterium]
MIDAAESLQRPRKRRRSRRRKLAESVALVLGVPALIFVVLALFVDVIEYRPVQAKAPDMTGVMPVERIEIPPLRLHDDPDRPSLLLR